MKLQNNILLFLFLIITSVISCTKENGQVFHYSPPPISPPPPPPPPPPVFPRDVTNAHLVPVGNLSQARVNMAVISLGNKIFFAGGESSPDVPSSRVDIFDFATNLWTTAELSRARSGIATAVSNNKIYFAGGAMGRGNYSGRVDIYDTQTNSWATTDFNDVQESMSGAAAGNKVVFASGVTAHIFNNSTNQWSTAPLSERPGEGNCCQALVGGIAATVIGNTIYFAGGEGNDIHNAIDIYNTEANTWSKSTLIEYKGAPAGIGVGNINYWAGGDTYSDRSYHFSSLIEIRNMITGAVSYGSLFQGNWRFSAVEKNDTIVFFTGEGGAVKNKFDIYAINSNKYSIGVLPENIEGAAIISANNSIYVAGGNVNGVLSNQVRKLVF